jgi:hypothetical protein
LRRVLGWPKGPERRQVCGTGLLGIERRAQPRATVAAKTGTVQGECDSVSAPALGAASLSVSPDQKARS